MEEQSNEALWYVVHTYSGYENKVANDLQTMVENRHLQDLICDIKVPVEMVPEIDKNGNPFAVDPRRLQIQSGRVGLLLHCHQHLLRLKGQRVPILVPTDHRCS